MIHTIQLTIGLIAFILVAVIFSKAASYIGEICKFYERFLALIHHIKK